MMTIKISFFLFTTTLPRQARGFTGNKKKKKKKSAHQPGSTPGLMVRQAQELYCKYT